MSRRVFNYTCGCGLKLEHEWVKAEELQVLLDWLAKEHKGRGHRAKAERPDAEWPQRIYQYKKEEEQGTIKEEQHE